MPALSASNLSFWLTVIKKAVAGTTINNAAAIKLPIIPTAELLETSGVKLADKIS